LALAVASVVAQNFKADEIVVVDDGSSPESAAANARVVSAVGQGCQLVSLPWVADGHGPAYSRNIGIAASSSQYICFLDDDDEWTDSNYLARVKHVVEQAARPFDLHFANQHAYVTGTRQEGAIWIDELQDIVGGRPPDRAGAFDVTVEDLLRCTGFCHLNATCVRRTFMEAVGGFDEIQRYESDRAFYLRAIDIAQSIKHSPHVVARHNVPDRTVRQNVSTAMSARDRWLFQLRLLRRVASESHHAAIRAYGRRHSAYTLKKLSETLLAEGDCGGAWGYAREALALGFNLKWAAFTGWVGFRHLTALACVRYQGVSKAVR
jgi:glycosyltransferase involved in cell wall biosynthesis